MTTSISGRPGQVTYFDHQFGRPDWTGKQVLDCGGKLGTVLLDPNCRIARRNYWCIELAFSFLDPPWTPSLEWPHTSKSALNVRWSQLYGTLEKNYGHTLDLSLRKVLMRAKEAALESNSCAIVDGRKGTGRQ
ncbi:MAG TPA: hypothetical protein VH912_07350 [Streptosporangiaceae bacterium]|jgi:hypothetical protein